jgi:hypothetical protein
MEIVKSLIDVRKILLGNDAGTLGLDDVILDGLRCCDRSPIKVAWTAQNWTRRNAPVDLASTRNGWPGGQVANEDQAGAGVSRH